MKLKGSVETRKWYSKKDGLGHLWQWSYGFFCWVWVENLANLHFTNFTSTFVVMRHENNTICMSVVCRGKDPSEHRQRGDTLATQTRRNIAFMWCQYQNAGEMKISSFPIGCLHTFHQYSSCHLILDMEN